MGQNYVTDENHVLNITPEKPEYIILEDEESLKQYIDRLFTDLLQAQKDENNVSVFKDKNQIVFSVWMY